MRHLVWLGVCCMATAACTADVIGPLYEPVRTDSVVYHLTRHGDLAYSVDIPFQYRNGTGRTISIVNCHGGLRIVLEKRVGGAWQTFYQPVLLLCLSPPIEIQPGEIYGDTARIYGVLPGHNAGPAFASNDLNGQYRLVWNGLVHGYDMNASGFGDALRPLVSNPFRLVAPE